MNAEGFSKSKHVGDEMYDAPHGFYFCSVSGKDLRHLVLMEAGYTTIALCGVQVFSHSRTVVAHLESKFCGKCVKEWKSAGSVS